MPPLLVPTPSANRSPIAFDTLSIIIKRGGVFTTAYVGYTGNFSARLYQHRSSSIGGPVGASAPSMPIYQGEYWGADAEVTIVVLAHFDGEMVDLGRA